MKILHTSDWHLGDVLYGFDRTEEQEAMLDQMVKIAEETQPDLFLISGDVYHTTDPKPAVQKLFNKTIAALCKKCPDMTIVVTAGNHDSGTKHEIFKTPWEALNVHTIGRFNKDNLESHIIEIPGKGYVIALPFTYDRFLPEDIYQQLIDLVSQRDTENLPVVFSAHTAISGGDFTGHDDVTDKRVGGVDLMDVKTMGQGYDYLALGHIHMPQFVHTGKHNARYSGSPLPVGFDEAYPHSVTLVDIPAHNAPLTDRNYSVVEIQNQRPLVTLPNPNDTTEFGPWETVYAQYEAYPTDKKEYIRLNISDPESMPSNAYNLAVAKAKDTAYHFCCINSKRKTTEHSSSQHQMTVEEFRATDPWDVVKLYATDTHNDSFDPDDMKLLFDEVLEKLKTKED